MNDMKERFKFNTVGLFTRDNKATVDFYTKAFGFTTDWDDIQPWGQRTCYVADPDGNLIEIGSFVED
jgi:catechol 2,3-dioxygenase-like lactoylglutathione lyase family enzyme